MNLSRTYTPGSVRPDPDDQVHRDQHRVEEEEVEGHEDPTSIPVSRSSIVDRELLQRDSTDVRESGTSGIRNVVSSTSMR